jgi:uncharacterized membrane protein YfcA
MSPIWTFPIPNPQFMTILYPVLFLTGLAAGFVDSIAGGGGLITLPVLLSLGLTPADALGTNKLQACFGSGSATFHYSRAGLINWKECRDGILFTAIGAITGTILVERIDPAYLRQAIPVLLITIALYVFFRPQIGAERVPARVALFPFSFWAGLAIGFYDGFFGPGTGTFWAMAYVLFLGFDLTRATAHTKVMNFTSNIGSLLIFLWGNDVLFGAGIVMGAGQLLGARLGANAVIKQGGRLIRPIFITIVILISLKLLYQSFKST